jgi:hypothetical protein
MMFWSCTWTLQPVVGGATRGLSQKKRKGQQDRIRHARPVSGALWCQFIPLLARFATGPLTFGTGTVGEGSELSTTRTPDELEQESKDGRHQTCSNVHAHEHGRGAAGSAFRALIRRPLLLPAHGHAPAVLEFLAVSFMAVSFEHQNFQPGKLAEERYTHARARGDDPAAKSL